MVQETKLNSVSVFIRLLVVYYLIYVATNSLPFFLPTPHASANNGGAMVGNTSAITVSDISHMNYTSLEALPATFWNYSD